MRFNNKWVTNILKVVDTLNTMNGGMSSPTFKLEKLEDQYLLQVKAPGVSPEAMRVEIVEDKLLLYHLIDLGNPDIEVVPNILKVMPIPELVELNKISAEFEDKRLYISMPFGKKQNGLYRSVNINLT